MSDFLYNYQMAICYHPKRGTILICDFHGFKTPEMIKRRPVVVISPQMKNRPGLCTVIPLSKTAPVPKMPYHYRFYLNPVLPSPYDSPYQWVKGDMIYSLSFARLNLPSNGRDANGKRNYIVRVIDSCVMNEIENCVKMGLGIAPAMYTLKCHTCYSIMRGGFIPSEI